MESGMINSYRFSYFLSVGEPVSVQIHISDADIYRVNGTSLQSCRL